MNILAEEFPTKILIDDTIYEINYDYNNCIKIILAFEDKELTIQEKYLILIRRLYKEYPCDIEQAVIKGVKFLNGGQEKNDIIKKTRIYSFLKDDKYIYTAISQTHHYDLKKENVHWWKFFFDFFDLSPNCVFSHMLDLRQRKNKGKLSKEELKLYYESQDILELEEDEKEISEEENEFMDLFNNGGDSEKKVTEK